MHPFDTLFKLDEQTKELYIPLEVLAPLYYDNETREQSLPALFLGSQEAFCFDIRSNEDLSIPRNHQAKVSTGIYMAMPLLSGLIMRERSGLADRGVRIGAGTIDSDYRGELKVLVRYEPLVDVKEPMRNIPDVFNIHRGDRICQAWIALSLTQLCRIKYVEHGRDLSTTLRGTGGFGSSGIG